MSPSTLIPAPTTQRHHLRERHRRVASNDLSARNTRDDQALRVEIERLAHNLNATWIVSDRSPIIETHFDSVDADATLAIMRLADIFMYTPTRRGMGTPAKQFSVLSELTQGVLILSDRSGAAAELGPYSVLVDGATPDSIVDGLKRAANLDAAHRDGLAVLRSKVVQGWTSIDWADRFVEHLVRIPAARQSPPTPCNTRIASRTHPQHAGTLGRRIRSPLELR